MDIIRKNILRIFDIEYFFSIKIQSHKTKFNVDRFVVKFMNVEELENLNLVVNERGLKYIQNVKNYLKKPDTFIGLICKDVSSNCIVYCCWIRKKSFFETKINEFVKLNINEAFFTDAYCVKKYRGNGLHSMMMKQRINYCFENDIKKAFIVIQAFNNPALSLSRKLYFKKIKTFIMYNHGSISYYLNRFFNKFITNNND
tara:strand:- start:21727 stop:22326 length:600 start_codon:yes stop_codon:yes gene_type:complete